MGRDRLRLFYKFKDGRRWWYIEVEENAEGQEFIRDAGTALSHYAIEETRLNSWTCPARSTTIHTVKQEPDKSEAIQAELDAVMQLGIDKWLDNEEMKNNPATRAAICREKLLKIIGGRVR